MTLTQPKQADKPYGPEPASGPLEPLKPYGPEQYSGSLQPLSTLDKLPPSQIANMSLENIEAARPVGWTIDKNNGFVHIKDENGTFRIKLDPPDWRTDYPHMHIYDENENLLDINGNIVNRRSPEGHIPWNNGGN